MQANSSVMDSLYRLARNLRRRPSDPSHPSRAYMKVLRILTRQGNLRARELSDALGVRPPSLSELLNKMEKEEIIVRNKDREDMRVTRVTITGKGREILEQHKDRRRKEDKKLEEWLTPAEREVFCQICDKLSQRLEEDAKKHACQSQESCGHASRDRSAGQAGFERGGGA